MSRPGSRLGVYFLVAVVVYGCGGDVSGPDGEPAASIVVSPSSDTLTFLGETAQFAASAYDVMGDWIPGKSFLWTSSRPDLASVDASGLVTAVENGATTITVTADGASAIASVTVRQLVEAVSVDPAAVTLSSARGAMQLTATANDAGGHAIPDRTFTWSSSDEGVATVSDSGLVTVVESGTVTIAATTDGVEGTTAIAGIDGVINGDFEAGDWYPGWTYGGTQNYSVENVEVEGNHLATISVGAGPIGDASCTNSSSSNFGYINQEFTLAKGQVVQLDFLVPVPGMLDPTENATCAGFDRIEIDFVIIRWSPTYVQTQLVAALTVDYDGVTGETRGRVSAFDANWTGNTVPFDPTDITPFTVGISSVQESDILPGWSRMSVDIDDAMWVALPEKVTFRITVRNEDNRNTGQHFQVSVDNVVVTPG